MKKHLNAQSLQYKLCCDGFDLLDNDLIKLSNIEQMYVRQHTIFDIKKWDRLDKFLEIVLAQRRIKYNTEDFFGLSSNLCEKYEIGYYATRNALEYSFHDSYILFNAEQIKIWSGLVPKILDFEFMVAISRDLQGHINAIGLRLFEKHRNDISNAFKWLFPAGQNCTFGLERISNSKEIILVEGFTDMIAARESGYLNVVGLGSVNINEIQELALSGFDLKFCPDGDEYGKSLLNTTDRLKFCTFTPLGFKDPYQAFLETGKIIFHDC